MKKLSAIGIVAGVFLGGCAGAGPPPEKTLTVSNSAYKVDLLFTDTNGCSVYRFLDEGDYRYYVVGPKGAQMLPTTKTVEDTETDVETIDVGGGGGGHHGGHKK